MNGRFEGFDQGVKITDTGGKKGRGMRTGQGQARVMRVSPTGRWGT